MLAAAPLLRRRRGISNGTAAGRRGGCFTQSSGGVSEFRLVGIQRTRPSTGLAGMPRDLLVYGFTLGAPFGHSDRIRSFHPEMDCDDAVIASQ